MPPPRGRCVLPAPMLCALVFGFGLVEARADTLKLKDGIVLTGTVDKDGSLVQIFDDEGLRRVVIRDSKIESMSAETPPRPERFRLVQPLEVHGGEMPPYAIRVEATQWDELGRRRFKYVGPRTSKPVEMTQAINELGPVAVKYRGVDGFWVGTLDTRTVPRKVILGLLARVEQSNQDERIRVAQFLIQAEWFGEAKTELSRLEKDFPDLKENVAAARTLLLDAEARHIMAEVTLSRNGRQPRAAEELLRSFPTEGAPADVLTEVRSQLRVIQARAIEDRDVADAIRKTADALTEDERKAIEPRLLEILKTLAEAPEAVRPRAEPFRAATAEKAESRLALLVSAWAAGADHATTDPATADSLWHARTALRSYLQTTAAQDVRRDDLLKELGVIEVGRDAGGKPVLLDLPLLSDIVRQLPPPLHDDRTAAANATRVIRVFDDPNPAQPSEYAVWLPPEYQPAREYPLFVVLHGAESPTEALAPWIEEARRRGYILIAPEYLVAGQRAAYRYTGSEHAAVLLALRDAKRRFAIDSDRVFLAGTLEGGNMAWDFSLAHPDLLAGVAVISGFPGKFAWPYKANAPLVSMYITLGDLSAPTEDALVFEQWAKPLILRNNDIRYVKMYRRGLEPFPEEIPNVMAWAAARQRAPAPKQWEVVSGRESDDRFFGVVLRGFAPNRTTGPDAADALGKNIRPADIKFRANAVLNKATLETNGVTALDVWLGPPLFDFTKRVEVQINGKSVFKGQPSLREFGSYLEDLRLRGDREQTYWLKVPVNLTGRGGR